MTDAQISQTLFRAEQLANFAFLVRGECASELRQRSIKLPGGRGKKDTVGRGLQSQMEDLARKVGTGRKTLETDARIKDTFFPAIDETTLEQMLPLAKSDHMRLAQTSSIWYIGKNHQTNVLRRTVCARKNNT